MIHDLTVYTDDFGRLQIQANTDDGENFLESCIMDDMHVIDSDRISLPPRLRATFLGFAKERGLTVDV